MKKCGGLAMSEQSLTSMRTVGRWWATSIRSAPISTLHATWFGLRVFEKRSPVYLGCVRVDRRLTRAAADHRLEMVDHRGQLNSICTEWNSIESPHAFCV
jgi:hypothetical protein